jgi:dipeptidyl aminopeptidase/acylaminoacyl peptidase
MIAAVGLWMAMVGVGGAQTDAVKRPMTFADLMAMKRVSDPQISPSGKWVLFSVTDVSLEKNAKVNHLWVVGLKSGGSGKPGSENPDPGHPDEWQVTSGSGETNGRFSPDGKWVMYSAADNSGMGEIFVAQWFEDTGTMGAGRRVTGLETEADGAIWAPDSEHFLFVSSVYPECESHAAMGEARNEEEAQCNAAKDAAAAKSPVKAQVWDHLLYRHWDHYVGAKHSHIFYGSTEWDEKHQPLTPTDLTPASVVGDQEAPTFQLDAPLGYAISPDGKEIAYVVNLDKVPAESTNNDVFVLQVGAEAGTAKKVSTSLGSDDGPAYSPDGKWLAWRSQKRGGFESDLFGLMLYDRSAKVAHELALTMKDYSVPGRPKEYPLDRWVDEFVWSSDSQRVFFAAGDRGAEVIYGTNFTGDDLHRFGKTAGEWGGLVSVPNKYQLVATLMRVDKPSEVALADLSEMDDSTKKIRVSVNNNLPSKDVTEPTTPPHYLTHLNDALDASIEMAPIQPFWFAGAGGTQVEGFIVKPPHFDPGKKYPVKFLMHGGPQTAWGDAWSYRWNWELLAADGYVVIGVNRRGSTGYGQKFVDEVSGDWGGRAYEDLMKGLDYAEASYPFIDKGRECALGASYGGFMADWVLTHTDRFKCIVTHDGMYNPQSAFGTTEELWFNEWEFRPLEGSEKQIPSGDDRKKSKSDGAGDAVVERGKPAHPWDFYDRPASDDPFRKWSPMLFIKNAVTPTLVIHSQRDYRLDVSEGLQLFTALQLRGVPSRMLYFPDEGHWVLKPQNSALWYETVDDWCDRWTGMGTYAGVGAEKNPAASETR